jgi:hypothetical protein
MQKISAAQIQKIHAQLNTLGLMDDKKLYVGQYTSGRTYSTRDMSMDEATDLIQHFAAIDPRESHIKAVKRLAYSAKIIFGDSYEDHKMNDAKLDKFLTEKGTVKKQLKSQTLEELKKTHRQFEAIVINNRKTANNKDAKAATDQLFREMDLVIAPPQNSVAGAKNAKQMPVKENGGIA